MKRTEVLAALEEIAPLRLAEAWDNVGLLAGDPAIDCDRLLLAIDYTRAVSEETRRRRCDFVVAYHPPIFQPLKRIDAGGVIHDAIARGIAIYSPHTALDCASGGTNDVLCDLAGATEDRRPLRPAQGSAREFKLVTFVPEKQVDAVSDAIFAAGAGKIGDYSSCSFRSPGVGTFFGEEGTRPAVGEAGKLERAEEIRIETIVPIVKLSDVLGALRRSHPYEEPAFDLLQLAAVPEGLGQGRIGSLKSRTPRETIFERIRKNLGVDRLLIAGPETGDASRIAVCAGAGGGLLAEALEQGAELFLTGELRHHDALRAAEAGVTVVCTLHSNSERAALAQLKLNLEKRLPGLEAEISESDRDPFTIR